METKKIRMQVGKIDIPPKNPFENDLLNRKVPAEALTSLVDAIEGPYVLALDAAWGTGKTTFLDMWEWHLRNQEFPVVRFNAWETDFSDDPFVAFASELIESLEINKIDIDELKKIIKKLLAHAGVAAIRNATAGYIDLSELEKASLNLLSGERLDTYREAKKLVRKFKDLMQDAARVLSDEKEHPLIVMVDELDRCRPSYAVEFLEISKHLFSVDGIVFVLSVNLSELAHSVKSLYGDDFDAQGYLRRFFDDDCRLSQPNRKDFINALLRTKQGGEWKKFQHLSSMLHGFLGDPELSLRLVAQTIHRLTRVSASSRGPVSQNDDVTLLPLQEAATLMLRMVSPELYDRFVRGDASDLEVADDLFKRPRLKSVKEEEGGLAFQAFLIAAMRDTSTRRDTASHLEQRFKQDGEPKEGSPEYEILRIADIFSKGPRFQRIRQRVELFAEDPIDAG